MLSRRKFLVICGIATSGVLVGCGTASREPDYTVVIATGNVFEPAALTIPVGSTVAWHNRADHVHTVTADPAQAQLPERVIIPSQATAFDSGDLFAGNRWVHTFDTPGTYVYFCRYHELEEMLGAIKVNG